MTTIYQEVAATFSILRTLGFSENQFQVTQRNCVVIIVVRNNGNESNIAIGDAIVSDKQFAKSFTDFCGEYNKLSWEERDVIFQNSIANREKVQLIMHLTIRGLYDPKTMNHNTTSSSGIN